MAIHEIRSMEDLNAKMREAVDKLVVLDFFATWSQPCKKIAPTYEELSQEMSDVMFLKVNTDKFEDINQKYKINCMPTFIFIRKKKILYRFSGALVTKLKETISHYRYIESQ